MGADYGPAGRLRIAPARLLAGCYLDLGHRIDVADEAGETLFTVHFRDSVEVKT